MIDCIGENLIPIIFYRPLLTIIQSIRIDLATLPSISGFLDCLADFISIHSQIFLSSYYKFVKLIFKLVNHMFLNLCYTFAKLISKLVNRMFLSL